ncbi:MAG: DUF2752 domain-containing protein [Candidatus Zixiibacteriota bacterium]|nr:MAG: DUF2752 domain-containing protein [candidate division Zixibacteria bacterium]
MHVEIRNSRPAELVHMVWGPIAVLFIIAVGFFKNVAPHLPNCIFHEITGFPCPTCGGTRSLIALSQFDLVSSFMLNPLVPLFALGLILFSLLFLVGAVTRRSVKIKLTERGKRILRYSVFFLFAMNWIFLIIAGR